jgi:hypothetical protein
VTGTGEWPSDEVGRRLSELADALAVELGSSATVTREIVGQPEHPIFAVSIEPARTDCLRVDWLDFGVADLQVEAGHNGGRWELARTPRDVGFIEQIARSVVAGRVVETFGPGRSKVEVTLSDGSTQSETGGVAPLGCLPTPGWAKIGRRVRYAPYL